MVEFDDVIEAYEMYMKTIEKLNEKQGVRVCSPYNGGIQIFEGFDKIAKDKDVKVKQDSDAIYKSFDYNGVKITTCEITNENYKPF